MVEKKDLVKTLLTFFALSFLLAALVFLLKQRSVRACYRPPTCDFPCGDCECCPPCETPTPTPTSTSTPTPTPTDEPRPTPTEAQKPTPTPQRGHELGGPPVCGAETPDAPYLKSAVSIGGNKVELEWEEVENATHYSISYGPESGNYPWGVFDTGNTSHYTVEGIFGGCFAVKAVNGCAPSELSNEVCTGAISQVLGLSATSGESPTSPLVFWLGILALLAGVRALASQLSLLPDEK